MKLIYPIAFAALCFIAVNGHAQLKFDLQPTEKKKVEIKVRDLNWLNEKFLNKQRAATEDITRIKFGRQLRKTRADLSLLQKIIDRELVDKTDKETLQALGVALGDVLANEHKNLGWVVYEDELGPSHAVCLDKSEKCLFPITILSRRIEKGIKPNVEQLFEKALGEIKPYFPKLPYSD